MNVPTTGSARNFAADTGDSHTSSIAAWLERAVVGCLFAIAVCAPHSIAATQGFWVSGLLLWAARFTVRPRPLLFRTPIDLPLLIFFSLTVLAAVFSYAPDISISKLRSASLFTIVFLVAQNVSSPRVLRSLAVALIASCMINVVYTFGERALGRGVRVEGLAAESPLRGAGVEEGDTLLELDGAPLHNLAEVESALATGASERPLPRIKVYRYEAFYDLDITHGSLLSGATPEARLGVGSWTRGRDWRAAGFYGHYTTYAEALQLIASLALGLLIALHFGRGDSEQGVRSWRTRNSLLLGCAVAGLCAALLMTVTRASWLAFLVSAFTIVLVGARSRRVALVMVCAALLLVPLGLFVLQQKRNVGFLDRRDASTTWRATVYREGVELLFKSPRHMLVGVGMDSIRRFWPQWGMFEQGRIPRGHLHSTPLMIAVERGLPALFVWFWFLFTYGRTLWRMTREKLLDSWIERGIALGALGGLAGLFTSGIVHYNLGDSEVVMIFYFIVGLALVVNHQAVKEHPTREVVINPLP
ncbi:MAG: O-antigen ligase family protein [Pyrinomonadaceae bacterium]|nr:O-antigen ligase family protein [Pyrinomonadaceae bacterium]